MQKLQLGKYIFEHGVFNGLYVLHSKTFQFKYPEVESAYN